MKRNNKKSFFQNLKISIQIFQISINANRENSKKRHSRVQKDVTEKYVGNVRENSIAERLDGVFFRSLLYRKIVHIFNKKMCKFESSV